MWSYKMKSLCDIVLLSHVVAPITEATATKRNRRRLHRAHREYANSVRGDPTAAKASEKAATQPRTATSEALVPCMRRRGGENK